MKYVLALPFLALSGVAFAQDAEFEVTGYVVEQTCVNADVVEVTLSADDNATEAVGFRWDKTGDGVLDSPPKPVPDQVFRYPDGVVVTAHVYARTESGMRDRDRVRFETIDCE
jgi:hypothetical protein